MHKSQFWNIVYDWFCAPHVCQGTRTGFRRAAGSGAVNAARRVAAHLADFWELTRPSDSIHQRPHHARGLPSAPGRVETRTHARDAFQHLSEASKHFSKANMKYEEHNDIKLNKAKRKTETN